MDDPRKVYAQRLADAIDAGAVRAWAEQSQPPFSELEIAAFVEQERECWSRVPTIADFMAHNLSEKG